jgi:hypothetical protein
LTSQHLIALAAAEDLILHRQVPLKVSIFAWRLLRDRLPTKVNMVARCIISPDALFCVSGCGDVESTHHLFLSCSFFRSLWLLVRSWNGFLSVDTQQLSHHFLQFSFSPGSLSARRSFLQLIWLVYVWLCGMKGIRDYSKIRVFPTSTVGQSQTIFLLVVEDYEL